MLLFTVSLYNSCKNPSNILLYKIYILKYMQWTYTILYVMSMCLMLFSKPVLYTRPHRF